jgi:hypothetical protein
LNKILDQSSLARGNLLELLRLSFSFAISTFVDVVQKFREAWIIKFSATKRRSTYIVGLQALIVKVVMNS